MPPDRRGTAPFFLLTFAITWGLQVPGVLAQRGFLPGDPNAYMPMVGLGIFGPLIAATILTRREGGGAAVRALYARLLHWRVHPRYYVVAFILPAVLLTGSLFSLNLAGRHGPIEYVPAIGALAVGVVISAAEEVGWRGYAQPRLQERWGPFASGVLIGVLWYLWHIPMFLGLGVPLNLVFVMVLYFAGAGLLLSWVHNGTGGSLLVASLVHLGAHLNNSSRALPDDVLPLVAHAIIFAGLGLIVMRRSFGKKRSKKGPEAPAARLETESPSTPVPPRATLQSRLDDGQALGVV